MSRFLDLARRQLQERGIGCHVELARDFRDNVPSDLLGLACSCSVILPRVNEAPGCERATDVPRNLTSKKHEQSAIRIPLPVPSARPDGSDSAPPPIPLFRTALFANEETIRPPPWSRCELWYSDQSDSG